MNSLSKIFFSLGLIAFAGCSQAVSLFDEAQAERLRLSAQEWQALEQKSATTRSFNFDSDGQRGPLIRFLFPELGKQSEIVAGSPTDLTILFEGTSSEVDMSSLEVEISKGWFSFSITDKLSPYIEGSRISAQAVEIPSGNYKVEILVKDIEGNQTEATYLLSVR
jgi:hypothetical protein